MSYPSYPDNRLIVNGVDLSTEFGLILADGYTLKPPTPKTYTVEIPGGNGKLDLTDSLLGDTAYNNREQEFTFYVIDPSNFEETKTKVSNFLHGKAYDYIMTMDPDYTYHGRFTVSETSHSMYNVGIVGSIDIKVDGKPFKIKRTQVVKANAIGGILVTLESGRMRVRPIIETSGLVRVIFNNKQYMLQQGSWAINDILFRDGLNYIYFNSYDIRSLKWGDLKTNSITWGDLKTRYIFEWYKSNGDGTYVMKTWFDLYKKNKTWDDLKDQTWADQMYMSDVTETVDNVYVEYEWGDL